MRCSAPGFAGVANTERLLECMSALAEKRTVTFEDLVEEHVKTCEALLQK